MDLLTLFFLLLRSHDKALRQYLEDHIISDIKNMNAKQKNMKLNGVSFKFGLIFLRCFHFYLLKKINF